MQEIERKYLVSSDDFRHEARTSYHIAQGYLCTKRVTARIRIRDKVAFLTLKGKSHDGGLSRFEWERPIPLNAARGLLSRCSGVIEKRRFLVEHEGYTWEIDVFEGDNEGLVVAECELSSTNERPPLPRWILKEVTGSRFYHNSFLVKHPYKEWGV